MADKQKTLAAIEDAIENMNNFDPYDKIAKAALELARDMVVKSTRMGPIGDKSKYTVIDGTIIQRFFERIE